MERELRLGNTIVILDDRHGVLDRTIEQHSGRPLADTSSDKTVEVARMPPEGLPNTSDPLGVAHAEGQLYGAIYDGRIAPGAFAFGWVLATLGVIVSSVLLLGDERHPTINYVLVALTVALWTWLFQRAFRRMREHKRRLDASIPPR